MQQLREAQEAHRRLYEERAEKEQFEKEAEERRNEEKRKQIEQDEEYSLQLLKELQAEGAPDVESQDYQRVNDEPDGPAPMRTGYTDTLIGAEPWWIAMDDVHMADASSRGGRRFFSLGSSGLPSSGSTALHPHVRGHTNNAHAQAPSPAVAAGSHSPNSGQARTPPIVGDNGTAQQGADRSSPRFYSAFPGFPVIVNPHGWQSQHRERLLNFEEGMPEMPTFTSRSQGTSIANAALRRYLEWSETQRFIFLLGIGSFIAFVITVFCRAGEGS